VNNKTVHSQLFLVLGSGGVGKTSCSAALGLALAHRGYRTVVITIDPAKRLAQALGLDSLSNEAQRVLQTEKGHLDALWLDSKTAFTDLVKRQIKNEALANKILNNRLFKIIQEQLGGIEEYLSVEKLLGLGSSGEYDICVLDTPPSRHALDFIESPKHLLKFFDDSVLKIFLSDDEEKPKGFFSKIFSSTRTQALEIFKRFLGQKFMSDLAEMLANSRPVHDALRETAHGVEAWVRREDTRSILVSLPEKYPLEEAYLLGKEILAHEMHKANLLLINRCLPSTLPHDPSLLMQALGNECAQHLIDQHKTQSDLIQSVEEEISSYAQGLACLSRFSNSKMNLDTLTEIGKDLLQQWEQKEPSIFLKN
jgi:anion-transporting  ArsA/GET3 family ATPase